MSEKYIPPSGQNASLTFDGVKYSPPSGDAAELDFAGGTGPVKSDQYVFPVQVNAPDMSAPTAWLYNTLVYPFGFSDFGIGSPGVKNWRTYALPGGIAAPGVGSHSIMLQNRPVAPSGIGAFSAGTPTIINRNRYIIAGGIDALTVSSSSNAWLYTRYLVPGGANVSAYGTQAVTHGKRYLSPSGIAVPGTSTPWVSESPRLLSPAGFWLDATGRPVIVTPRTVTPAGWDSAQFGTRIIPEEQRLYPLGLRADQWGASVIWKWKTVAAPTGFALSPQEGNRFGFAKVWNLRQIIQQSYDSSDGLNPPGFGIWTAIENRNRMVGVSGIEQGRFGYTQIDNKAAPMLPLGIAPPAVAGGAVTHKNRPFTAGGIEPLPVSVWHVVYNAAKVLSPSSFIASAFGTASAENNRRVFGGIGGFESSSVGTPFIADRIRRIEFDPRYAIAPPVLPLPEAKLYTRYVAATGSEMQGVGSPSLSIHRNVIEPRWTHRDLFGDPQAKNATPEIPTFGHDSAEFGGAEVKLFSRYVIPAGMLTQDFGRPWIADTKRSVLPGGVNMLSVSTKLTVVRTGAPPYAQQNIIIEDGSGINAYAVFGTPSMSERSIRPTSIDDGKIGSATVYYMGIHVTAGPKTDSAGVPTVQLKIRGITVGEFNSDQVFQPSSAAVSPHTIYAVTEAPAQAIANHPPRTLHFVGGVDRNGVWVAGERFGLASLSRPAGAYLVSASDVSRYGTARVDLHRRYLLPGGIQAYRFGWHKVSDGVETLTVFAPTDSMALGSPSIARGAYFGPQTVRAQGLDPGAVSAQNWISLLHRKVQPAGTETLLMGYSRGGTEYMPQSLHVGPRKPTMPAGFDVSVSGTPWVSLRVRELRVPGFDAFVSEYDPQSFSQRMRVTRVGGGVQKPASRALGPTGIDALRLGTAGIRNRVHFIRPDGNSDQFRKGAF